MREIAKKVPSLVKGRRDIPLVTDEEVGIYRDILIVSLVNSKNITVRPVRNNIKYLASCMTCTIQLCNVMLAYLTI